MVWLSTDAVAPSRDVTSPGWVSPVEVPGHSGAPAGRSFRPTPVLRSPVRGGGGEELEAARAKPAQPVVGLNPWHQVAVCGHYQVWPLSVGYYVIGVFGSRG